MGRRSVARNGDSYTTFERYEESDDPNELDALGEQADLAAAGASEDMLAFDADEELPDQIGSATALPDDGAGWDDWPTDDELEGPLDGASSYPAAPLNPRVTRKVPALHALEAAYDEQGNLVGMTQVARVPAERELALPPMSEETAKTQTVFIRGSGTPHIAPFLRRRQRSLTLRIVATCLVVTVALTVLFTVTPLASVASQPISGFQGLTGAVLSNGEGYTWYTAVAGDTPESIAQSHHVQLGGFYEINNFYQGEEIVVGQQYKIPDDPNYGEGYVPPSPINANEPNYGSARFGPNWWDSIAGNPPAESPCAPDGGLANPLGYHLISPNWNSVWVRGFIVYGTWVYHTGVDMAAPQGNPIHAAQAGQVIWAGYDATNGLGWSVKIDNCNHISTVYGHMLQLLVHTGEYVDVGDEIGLEGSTGNSTGPHLHFMVEVNNLWVDPMQFYTSQYSITHYVAP